jgi:hypothetical protein
MAGVSLQEGRIDSLLWSEGDGSGTKNAYDVILSTMNLPICQGWKKNIWKWGLPLKITLFFWMAMEGRLSTWDKLQSKGWIGLGICLLCNQNAEDIAHLFIHCPFVVSVWAKCAQLQNTIYIWTSNSINQCMEEWVGNKAMTKRLPALVCWHIWLELNNLLFEGKGPSTWSVAHKTLNMLWNLPNGTKMVTKSLRVNFYFQDKWLFIWHFLTVLQWIEVQTVGQVEPFSAVI